MAVTNPTWKIPVLEMKDLVYNNPDSVPIADLDFWDFWVAASDIALGGKEIAC